MPLHCPSFFIPVSLSDDVIAPGDHPYLYDPSPGFILEDIYIKGGLRCLPSLAVRDALPISSVKAGMLVYTPENGGNFWRVKNLDGNTVTWSRLNISDAVNQDPDPDNPSDPVPILGAIDPIFITPEPDNEIMIDPLRILPPTKDAQGIAIAFENQIVSLDSNLIPYWKDLAAAGMSGVRIHWQITCPVLDVYNSPVYEFQQDMGRLVIVLHMEVDVPDVRVRCYGTSARDEVNPYHFISTAFILHDDGVTELPDGTYDNKRKYTILCNKDDPTSPALYWEVIYLGNTDASRDANGAVIQFRQPTLKFTYVVIEP